MLVVPISRYLHVMNRDVQDKLRLPIKSAFLENKSGICRCPINAMQKFELVHFSRVPRTEETRAPSFFSNVPADR